MNRQEKSQVIDVLKRDFRSAEASFVLGVKGLTVSEVQNLRKDLHVKESEYKVAKNTLLKLAVQDMGNLKDLSPYFTDQVAVVFANKDASNIANILYKASKGNDKLTLIGGSLDGKVLTSNQVEYLAKLPAREVLLAQVCGTLNAPITTYVNMLNQLIVRLLWVLKKIEEKK